MCGTGWLWVLKPMQHRTEVDHLAPNSSHALVPTHSDRLQVEEQTSSAAGEADGMAFPAAAGASTSGSGGECTPFSVQLRSLEQRVAGMGGIPGEQRLCGMPLLLLPAAGNMVWGS